MKIARSTYFDNLNRKPSNRNLENNKLKSLIYKIYIDSKNRYGCCKIRHILQTKGYHNISVNRVSRLMKQLNIKSITIKKFKNYKQKLSDTISYQNLIGQKFVANKPNQIWLSDITYIHTIKNGWTYLASILDACTRKIVGFCYARKMNKYLVISALKNAYSSQNCPNDIILHSDRGSQYTSNNYIALAKSFNMKLSYSKKVILLITLLWNLSMLLLKKKRFILDII